MHTLHYITPAHSETRKMLVKLPYLTRQHHLLNHIGAKNGIHTKMQILFLLQLQQNLLLYGHFFDDFPIYSQKFVPCKNENKKHQQRLNFL